MRAAVLEEVGKPLVVDEVELGAPGPGEVLVRIAATGVCRSDLAVATGELLWPTPAVLGHEAAGEVLEAGEGVRGFAPGDHVVISWVPMCRTCFFCTRGQPHLCNAYYAVAGTMDDGTTRLRRRDTDLSHAFNAATFAERAVLRETSLVKVPPDVPLETVALLGCGVLTGVGAVFNTARVQAGDRVAVIGCGGVGLNVIQACRVAGAAVILAVDPVEAKREAALRFGATHVGTPDEAAKLAKALTGGIRPDVVFEVVGRQALQRAAFDMVRAGGKVVLVGAAPVAEEVSFPNVGFLIFERSVLGCYYGSSDPRRDVPRILELWRAGQLDLESLVSERAPLERVNDAFAAIEAGTAIRTLLVP